MNHLLVQGNALRLPLADQSIHCCVTSPPYFGLRDYGVKGQIGLEATPDEFVAAMVAVFREVWRVLRDDGTLWLNLGDSYNAYNGGAGPSSWEHQQRRDNARPQRSTGHALQTKTLKPKDLLGMPWRVAFALQADGWYLRSDIIWHKPNPMPESTRDRPTKAHEYLFLMTKRPRYFYDAKAIEEPATYAGCNRGGSTKRYEQNAAGMDNKQYDTRTKRTVWSVNCQPYKGAHFATFPPRLITPCIQAGTSEKGCCSKCGAPWRRLTKTAYDNPGNRATNGPRSIENRAITAGYSVRLEKRVETLGWESSCGHLEAREPIPCVVLDPFAGVFTTSVVAASLGRSSVGVELSASYIALARERLRKAIDAQSSARKPKPKAVIKRDLPGQLNLF